MRTGEPRTNRCVHCQVGKSKSKIKIHGPQCYPPLPRKALCLRTEMFGWRTLAFHYLLWPYFRYRNANLRSRHGQRGRLLPRVSTTGADFTDHSRDTGSSHVRRGGQLQPVVREIARLSQSERWTFKHGWGPPARSPWLQRSGREYEQPRTEYCAPGKRWPRGYTRSLA